MGTVLCEFHVRAVRIMSAAALGASLRGCPFSCGESVSCAVGVLCQVFSNDIVGAMAALSTSLRGHPWSCVDSDPSFLK